MLRLPPIVDWVPVRHVVLLPPDLDRALREYASAYAATYETVKPVADLIPAILASFIASDRAFARWQRAQT